MSLLYSMLHCKFVVPRVDLNVFVFYAHFLQLARGGVSLDADR